MRLSIMPRRRKRLSMRWKTAEFRSPDLEHVDDRQERLPGYSTAALRDTCVNVIGAGGLANAFVPPLARKGVGSIEICDADCVELTNLNRQGFFPSDLGQNKAVRLAQNAARQGALGSRLVGHATDFTSETAELLLSRAQIVIVGVDNDLARKLASDLCRQKRIPAIFTAVNTAANHGYVFVQVPDGPCLACVFPSIAAADSDPERCIAHPAVIDILRVLGGFVLYAVDSLLMPRVRLWNYRSVNLIGGAVSDENLSVERRAHCPMCARD